MTSEIKYIQTMSGENNKYTKKLFVNIEGQITIYCNDEVKSINDINLDLLKEQIADEYKIKFLRIKNVHLKGDD